MTESIVDVFDQASATYDSVGVDFFTPMGAALVEAASPQPGRREALRILARHAEGAPPPRRNDDLFQTAGSVTEAARGAGFETISVRDVTVDSSFRDAGQLFTWIGSHAGRQMVQHIPPARRDAAVAEVGATLGFPITFHTQLRIVLAE
jgi:hypothetical protein